MGRRFSSCTFRSRRRLVVHRHRRFTSTRTCHLGSHGPLPGEDRVWRTWDDQQHRGMFGIFAGLGLGLTTTKYVAELRATDSDRAGRIIGLPQPCAISGGLIALGLILFAPFLAVSILHAPHLVTELRIGSLLLFLNALNGVQTGTLAGFEAFKLIAKANLWQGLLTFPLEIGGVIEWGSGAVWVWLRPPASAGS